MNKEQFDQIDNLNDSKDPQQVVDYLIESLEKEQAYHQLFDARLMHAKLQLGLPLTNPTSFDDVPEEQQAEFQKAYVEAARAIGSLLLEQSNIVEAWAYFRTIQETDKIREAIEALPIPQQGDPVSDRILEIALYEGAHPSVGLNWMLKSHGICNTVTAFDQHAQQMSAADRRSTAIFLIKELYNDLLNSIQYAVEQRLAMVPPGESLRELMAGRAWLFDEGSYHVDVSHLHAVVRFARFLRPDDPELKLAIELTEYGAQLEEQLQYPGDPPFEDFYVAHGWFFKALCDENRDDALAYFRKKIEDEPDAEDKPMLAYVLVDLLLQCEQKADAVSIAAEHFQNLDPSMGVSFADVCREADDWDALKSYTAEQGDLVGYAGVLLQQRMSL